MSCMEPGFWKYLTYNDDGMMDGISEDAPQEEKEAYRKYLEEETDNFKLLS